MLSLVLDALVDIDEQPALDPRLSHLVSCHSSSTRVRRLTTEPSRVRVGQPSSKRLVSSYNAVSAWMSISMRIARFDVTLEL